MLKTNISVTILERERERERELFLERERERELFFGERGCEIVKEIHTSEGEKMDRIYEDNWDSTWTNNVVLRAKELIDEINK